MIFDEECFLIVAQNVYVGVSGTTGRVLRFLPVSSQDYQGSFQDGEGELLPDIVDSVRIRTVQLLTHFFRQYSMISLCLLTQGAVGRKNQVGKRGMLYLQNAVVVFDFFSDSHESLGVASVFGSYYLERSGV